MRKRNGLAALAVSVLLAGLAASPANAGPRTGSGRWQSYLEQPATSDVRAVSATVLAGDVTNARGLTCHCRHSAGRGNRRNVALRRLSPSQCHMGVAPSE